MTLYPIGPPLLTPLEWSFVLGMLTMYAFQYGYRRVLRVSS